MLPTLLTIAQDAGRRILSYYDQPITVEHKADNSPLTLADQAAHHCIVDALAKAFPDIPVLSEESDADLHETRKTWNRFFLVDPLDGTKDFIKKTGCFTVNIALIEDGKPTAGVIHVPARELNYWAATGEGAWRQANGGNVQRIHVSTPDMSAPRIVASRDHAGPDVAALLARFPGHSCLHIGSSLKFCMVAEAAADIYLRDVPTMEWDVAAAQIIVQEAGGQVYDLTTLTPLTYNKNSLRNPPLLTLGHSQPKTWLPDTAKALQTT